MKKLLRNSFLAGLLVCLSFVPDCGICSSNAGLSITGAVLQPLHLTMDDLSRYQTIQVQLNEVRSDGGFHGVFTYQGVPLQTLLSLARIAKGDTSFSQPIDLAIRLTSRQGQQVALSWGEVFCKNPSSVVIATAAVPVMPKKECTVCHTVPESKLLREPYERKPALPKLVVSDDRYADRCLEDISSIEIIDLRPRMEAKKLPQLYSPSFDISGSVQKKLTINKLSAFPETDTPVRHGECRGYHGIQKYSGTALKNIAAKAGIAADINSVLLVSAPDGYRALVSYGELFLSSPGERIIIADHLGGKSLEKDGRYYLICAEDLVPDRRVDAVSRIEVLSLREQPKLYVIGVGCGDTSLITLEALSYMAKADAFICTEDIKKRFGKYMGDKPMLFDMYDYTNHTIKKQNPTLAPDALKKLLKEKQAHAAGIVRDVMKNNKSVALLDYGDPAIFTGSAWVKEFFTEQDLKIITGISSFNAANALQNKKFDGNRSIVLTTPWDITANPALLKAAASHGDAVVVFMALNNIDSLMPVFNQSYAAATPVFVVYKAGYAGGESVMETTMAGVQQAVAQNKEKLLGLLYIGAPTKKEE
jgi:precorrin-4 methylase